MHLFLVTFAITLIGAAVAEPGYSHYGYGHGYGHHGYYGKREAAKL